MGDANLQCDFCSAPCPSWRYPARSFIAYRASNLAGESVGDWAACDACHKLIEADDHYSLAQRSLDELIVKHPEARAAAEILFQDLAELHRQFFEHRRGPAVPIADAA
jgi:hypothetical protein